MLKPNAVYNILGVTVNEKIIPAGTKLGGGARVSKPIGKVQSITVHNTEDLKNVYDDAEQYTRATYNGAMGGTVVHFYVDDVSIWQNLKAGLGLCPNDPKNSAERGSHTADSEFADGGNATSIALEVIMNESPETDKKAYDNAARLCAYLLHAHGLGIDKLVSHTYWGNKSYGSTFADVDRQCTNPIYGRRWCPVYIFGSTDKDVAYKNWKAFKAVVKGYMTELEQQDKPKILYRVQVGAFKERKYAEAYMEKAVRLGFPAFIVLNDDNLYRVQVGAFSVRKYAETYLNQVKAAGLEGFIIEVETK